MTDTFEVILLIVGLTVVTLITRCLFLMPNKEMRLPDWIQRGMRYVPLAALIASVVPQILLTNGQAPQSWHDAKLVAAIGASVYFWRRAGILGTIVTGTVLLLLCRVG